MATWPVTLKRWKRAAFVKVHKGFIGRKTNTTYAITKAGEKAFKEHLEAMEKVHKEYERYKRINKIMQGNVFFLPFTLKYKVLLKYEIFSNHCLQPLPVWLLAAHQSMHFYMQFFLQ